MFSYSFAFSDSQACKTCCLFIDLEARINELETEISSIQQQLAGVDQPSLADVSCSLAGLSTRVVRVVR